MTGPGEASPATRARPNPWQVVVLLLLTFLVYAPALGNGFAMDDQPLAESVTPMRDRVDPMVGELQSPLEYFRRYYWYPHSKNDGLYRPITIYSYALTYWAVGRHLDRSLEGLPQHLLNLLLHVWATWLVLRMVLVLRMPPRAALLTAALFGLHAIHSEVVAGIVGRAELFAFCFGLAGVLRFAGGGPGAKRTLLRPVLRPVLAGLLLFLAFCSKESALAWIGFLPCFLLAHAWRHGLGAGEALRARWWQALLVTGVPLVTWFWLRSGVMNDPNEPVLAGVAFSQNHLAFLPAGTRILTAIKIWGFGLWKCLVPYPLCCIYSVGVFQDVSAVTDLGFLLSALVLALFLVAGLVFARRNPMLFLAMTLFLGFSFLTANVLFPIGTVFGERLFYTPSLGICLLPAALMPWLRSRLQQACWMVLLFWMAANALVCWQRSQVWKNDKTLFLHDVRVLPNSMDLARKAAGMFMEGPDRDLNKANQFLSSAVTRDGRTVDYPLGWLDLGDIQRGQGNWESALKNYQVVLKSRYLKPSGAEPFAWLGIGNVWLHRTDRKRDLDEAEAAFQKSIAAEPRNHLAATGLGLVYEQRRDFDRAVHWFRQALVFHPAYRPAWMALANMPWDRLSQSLATRLFREGVQRFPQDPEMALHLGRMGVVANLDMRQSAALLEFAIHKTPAARLNDYNILVARLKLAQALWQLGDKQRARIMCQRVANIRNCPPQIREAAQSLLKQR